MKPDPEASETPTSLLTWFYNSVHKAFWGTQPNDPSVSTTNLATTRLAPAPQRIVPENRKPEHSVPDGKARSSQPVIDADTYSSDDDDMEKTTLPKTWRNQPDWKENPSSHDMPLWPVASQTALQTVMSNLSKTPFGKKHKYSMNRLFAFNEGGNDLYLSDDIIQQYFNYLKTQTHLSIFLISSLHFGNGPDYTKNILKKQNNFESLQNAKRIFCPINKGKHWYLAIIVKEDTNHYQIELLDTLNRHLQNIELYNAFEGAIKSVFDGLIPNITWGETKRHTVREQDNGIDCGAAICYYGMLVANNIPIPEANPNATWNYYPFRLEIAQAILATEPTPEPAQAVGSKRKPNEQPENPPKYKQKKYISTRQFLGIT